MEKSQYFFNNVCDANIEVNNKPLDLVLTTDDVLQVVKKGVAKALESWLAECVNLDGVSLNAEMLSVEELERGVWLRTQTFGVLVSWEDILQVTFQKAASTMLHLWCKVDEEHQPDSPQEGTVYAMLDMEKYTDEDAADTLLLVSQLALERMHDKFKELAKK